MTLATALGALLMTTTTAIAPLNTPLDVSLGCGSGRGVISCSATISGGSAPYAIRWNQGAQYNGMVDIDFDCTSGTSQTVRVTVTDAAGASVSRSKGVACR
ncbi:hypothetical protein R8Z50_01970 [Longispora sp. K20-0274]|uniref:hypothetical protein n=1 Tax=Longispora sp. K20-0274 TaxID=3088255 RepID=UPI00399B7E4A